VNENEVFFIIPFKSTEVVFQVWHLGVENYFILQKLTSTIKKELRKNSTINLHNFFWFAP